MKTLSKPLVLLFCAIVVGVGVASFGLPEAGGQEKKAPTVGLGMPAGIVITAIGSPEKINYDMNTQIWFYRSKSGALEPRFELNQVEAV